jgi:hypothetical protein
MLSGKQQAETLQSLDQEIREHKSGYERIFCEAVGRALSFWARLEELLVVITAILLGTQFTKAGIVMYSIVNFHVRINIINELFSLEPSYGKLETKWNKIAENLRSLTDTRDRLAHHTVYSRYSVDDSTTKILDTSLRPAYLDLRKKSQKYQPLDFDQLMHFLHTLQIVYKELAELINAMKIIQQETSQQKSS